MTKDHEERADIVRRLDVERSGAGERRPAEGKSTAGQLPARQANITKKERVIGNEAASAAAAIVAAVDLVQHLAKDSTRNGNQSPNAGSRPPQASRNWFLDLLGYKAWIPEPSTIRDQRRSRWSSLDAGSELYQSIREFAERLREYSATEEDRQCARLILRYSKHLSRAIERVLGPEHKGFVLRNYYTPEERLEILAFFFQTLKIIRQGEQDDAQQKVGAGGGQGSTELNIPPKVALDLQHKLRKFIVKESSRQLASYTSHRAQSLPELLDRWLCPLLKPSWEPRIHPGRRRVRYVCECGMKLYEDLPNEAASPESSLSKRRDPRFQSAVSEEEVAEQSEDLAGDVGPASKHDEEKMTGNKNKVDTIGSESSSTHQDEDLDLLHLLICVNRGYESLEKTFYQERLPSMTSDEEFFEFLHQTYYGRRKSWWASPWSVSKVGHCRIELQSNTIESVYEHPSSCPLQPTCQCWPPVSLIGRQYRCNPGTRYDDEHIGPVVLAHYFSNPQHSELKESKHRILDSVSKKIHPPLPAYGALTGWGIYIEEGWHMPTCVVLALFILLALFGITFIWKRMLATLP